MIWYLLGAGAIGSLAAHYLHQMEKHVAVLPHHAAFDQPLVRSLHFPDGSKKQLVVTQVNPAALKPKAIRYLLVATKANKTQEALAPWLEFLDDKVTLIVLQNGLGQLDDITLPEKANVIYGVTQSGANRQDNIVRVVAENTTLMGGNCEQPYWFEALQAVWPQLQWTDDITPHRLNKLAINAVINPLTALHNCANGELLNDAYLPQLKALSAEVDAVLTAVSPTWANATVEQVCHVAKLTANNISSMRADVLAGRATEIDFINGWIIQQATRHNIAVPHNQALFQQLT